MKFAFAAALVAAIALGQDAVEAAAEAQAQTEEMSPFVPNANGEMVIDWPTDLPGISFDEVTQQQVEDWSRRLEDAERELEERTGKNWETYMAAIEQPWNDFLAIQNDIKNAEIDLEAQTNEDILNWAASSIRVGAEKKTLGEMFPFDDIIAGMRDHAEWEKAASDLTQLSIHLPEPDAAAPVMAFRKPNAMFMDGCVEPADGKMSWCMRDPEYVMWNEASRCWQQTYPDAQCDEKYTEDCGAPCTKTEADQMEEDLMESLKRYGLTEEGIMSWAEKTNGAWEDLERRQEIEQVEQFQEDIRGARDGIIKLLDGILKDVQDAQQHSNADIEAQLQQMKAEAESKAAEEVENLERAIDDIKKAMEEFTNSTPGDIKDRWREDEGEGEPPMPEPVPEPVPAVALATEFAAEPESSNAAYYGIGAAALSTIAAAAYLYRKRQQKSHSDEFMRV